MPESQPKGVRREVKKERKFPLRPEQYISPSLKIVILKQIREMNFNYPPEAFERRIRINATDRGVSEDSLLGACKDLLAGRFQLKEYEATFARMQRALERESMKESPKREFFQKAILALASELDFPLDPPPTRTLTK